MIMTPDAEVFAEVMTVIVSSIGALTFIAVTARMIWKAGTRASLPRGRGELPSADIQRLELAIDSIAVEVERISEAQRFTVTLLSESLPRAVSSGQEPH